MRLGYVVGLAFPPLGRDRPGAPAGLGHSGSGWAAQHAGVSALVWPVPDRHAVGPGAALARAWAACLQSTAMRPSDIVLRQ